MIITKNQLKKGKCPVLEKDGYINSVLVVHKDSYYCDSNTYIGKWDCPNTIWYNNHFKDYEGYIELEFLIPKVNKKTCYRKNLGYKDCSCEEGSK